MPQVTRNSANFGVVPRRLAAQPDLGTGFVGLADDAPNYPLHRLVLLVEELREFPGVTIDTEGQLGEVIAADGKAVKALSEGLGEDDVRWNLAQDVDFEALLTALEALGHDREHAIDFRIACRSFVVR